MPCHQNPYEINHSDKLVAMTVVALPMSFEKLVIGGRMDAVSLRAEPLAW